MFYSRPVPYVNYISNGIDEYPFVNPIADREWNRTTFKKSNRTFSTHISYSLLASQNQFCYLVHNKMVLSGKKSHEW